jgi:hypothetical protein
MHVSPLCEEARLEVNRRRNLWLEAIDRRYDWLGLLDSRGYEAPEYKALKAAQKVAWTAWQLAYAAYYYTEKACAAERGEEWGSK